MYLKRREENREKGISTEYLTKRIKQFRRSLKLFEKKEEEVSLLAKRVKEFTEIDVWKQGSNKERKICMAKNYFYKIGLESKITPKFLIWYTNIKDLSTPYLSRKRFNKVLQKDKETMEKWHKFKKFVNEYEQQC